MRPRMGSHIILSQAHRSHMLHICVPSKLHTLIRTTPIDVVVYIKPILMYASLPAGELDPNM